LVLLKKDQLISQNDLPTGVLNPVYEKGKEGTEGIWDLTLNS
jgi:hypothetical protein